MAARYECPGKGCAAPIGVSRQLRSRVRDDRRERIAGAVAEAELRLPDRGHQQHVTDLVPDPASIGRDAERLRRRTVAAVPRLAGASRQVGQRQMYLQQGVLTGCSRTLEIEFVTFHENAGIDRLTILAGSRSDAGSIEKFERKPGDAEVLIRRQPIGFESMEELNDIPVRHDRRKVGRSDSGAGAGKIDALRVSRLNRSLPVFQHETRTNQHPHIRSDWQRMLQWVFTTRCDSCPGAIGVELLFGACRTSLAYALSWALRRWIARKNPCATASGRPRIGHELVLAYESSSLLGRAEKDERVGRHIGPARRRLGMTRASPFHL